MFVIVEEVNQYDQEGAYFVAVYLKKPSLEELTDLFNPDLALHIFTTGGGRIDAENEWYYLIPIEPGEQIDHDNLEELKVGENSGT